MTAPRGGLSRTTVALNSNPPESSREARHRTSRWNELRHGRIAPQLERHKHARVLAHAFQPIVQTISRASRAADNIERTYMDDLHSPVILSEQKRT
jgi:hypothetical protein